MTNARSIKNTKYLDGDSPDGVKVSKNPRSNPAQAPIPAGPAGQVVTFQQTLSPALIATITAAEQALTVGTTAGNGPATTDFLAVVNKPTAQAGLGFHSGRISAANTLQFSLSNPTAASVTPTATQIYSVVVLRGAPTHVQSLTPAEVPANSSSEKVFTIEPVQPDITVTVDGAGRLASVTLTDGGSGFYQVPTLVLTDSQGGKQGVLRCDVNDSGVITNVYIDDPGIGYVAPTISAIGGNIIEEGMLAMVNKPTQTTGIAIGNVRVAGKNQIAISFVNPTAGDITPTAEDYKICCVKEMPAISNLKSFGVVGTGLVSVAANTSAEQSLTVTGILATDIVVGTQKPTFDAGAGLAGTRVSAANTLGIGFINATAAAITPSATEIYGVTVFSQTPEAPLKIFRPVLSPVAVAANTTAEQTFTVTGLPVGSSVVVNKPAHQPGLGIAGVRVSAADTLAITFENVTALAITPTALEKYVVGCFMAKGPGGGVPGSWVALPFSKTLQRVIDQTQEQQAVMNEYGLAEGA